MKHNIAKKSSDETKKLMKTRADFEKLKGEKEQYLKERELEADSLLKDIYKEIDDAKGISASVQEKIIKGMDGLVERTESLIESLTRALTKTNEIWESIDNIKKKNEKALQILTDSINQVYKKQAELSVFEKDLQIKEKEVKEKDGEADEKLKEAKNLADWANSDQSYRVEKKNGKKRAK